MHSFIRFLFFARLCPPPPFLLSRSRSVTPQKDAGLLSSRERQLTLLRFWQDHTKIAKLPTFHHFKRADKAGTKEQELKAEYSLLTAFLTVTRNRSNQTLGANKRDTRKYVDYKGRSPPPPRPQGQTPQPHFFRSSGCSKLAVWSICSLGGGAKAFTLMRKAPLRVGLFSPKPCLF